MQVKKDLIDGELNCGENTAALLAAFILQGKCMLPQFASRGFLSLSGGHTDPQGRFLRHRTSLWAIPIPRIPAGETMNHHCSVGQPIAVFHCMHRLRASAIPIFVQPAEKRINLQGSPVS